MQNRTNDWWLLGCILVLFPGSLKPRSAAEYESGGLQRKDCLRMVLYCFAWLFIYLEAAAVVAERVFTPQVSLSQM